MSGHFNFRNNSDVAIGCIFYDLFYLILCIKAPGFFIVQNVTACGVFQHLRSRREAAYAAGMSTFAIIMVSLWVGATFGFFAAALCQTARSDDDNFRTAETPRKPPHRPAHRSTADLRSIR